MPIAYWRDDVKSQEAAALLSDPDGLREIAEALPLTEGAAAEVASASFALAGVTGAVARPLNERAADRLSLLDFIPVAQHAAIRALTSTYDCVAVLRVAVAAAAGKTLVVPGPGKYFLNQVGIVYDDTAIVDEVKCSLVCEPGAYFETATPDSINGTFLRVRGPLNNPRFDIDWRDTNADYTTPDVSIEGCNVVMLDPRDGPIVNPACRVKGFGAVSAVLCYGGAGVTAAVHNLAADVNVENSVYGLSLQNCLGYRANIRAKNVKRAHFINSLWPVRDGFFNLEAEGTQNGFDCLILTANAADILNVVGNFTCLDATLYSPVVIRKLSDTTKTIANVTINFRAPNAATLVPVYVRDQTAAGVDTTAIAPGDLRFRNVVVNGMLGTSAVNGYLQYPQVIRMRRDDINRARRAGSVPTSYQRNLWSVDEEGWAWLWTSGASGITSWTFPLPGPNGLPFDAEIEVSFKSLPGSISAPDMVFQRVLSRHGRSGGGLGQNGAKTLITDIRTGAGSPVDPNLAMVLGDNHVVTITHSAWTHLATTYGYMRVRGENGMNAPAGT